MLVADHEPFERLKKLRDVVKKHELQLGECELHWAPQFLRLLPRDSNDAEQSEKIASTGNEEEETLSQCLHRIASELETQIEAVCSDVETRRSSLDHDAQILRGDIEQQLSLFFDGLANLDLLDTRIEELRRRKDDEAISRSTDAEKVFQHMLEKRAQICAEQRAASDSIACHSNKHIRELSASLQSRWKSKKALEEEWKSVVKLEKEQLYDSIHLDSNSCSWLDPLLTCQSWPQDLQVEEKHSSSSETNADNGVNTTGNDNSTPGLAYRLEFSSEAAPSEIDEAPARNGLLSDAQSRCSTSMPSQWLNEGLRSASNEFEILLTATRKHVLRTKLPQEESRPAPLRGSNASTIQPVDAAICFLEQRRRDHASLERMHRTVAAQVARGLSWTLDYTRNAAIENNCPLQSTVQPAGAPAVNAVDEHVLVATPALDFLRKRCRNPEESNVPRGPELRSDDNELAGFQLSSNDYANCVFLLAKTLLPQGIQTSSSSADDCMLQNPSCIPPDSSGSNSLSSPRHAGAGACAQQVLGVARNAAAFVESIESALSGAAPHRSAGQGSGNADAALGAEDSRITTSLAQKDQDTKGDCTPRVAAATSVELDGCTARGSPGAGLSAVRLPPRRGVSKHPPYPTLD